MKENFSLQKQPQDVTPVDLSPESYKYISASEAFTLTTLEITSNGWSHIVCDDEIIISGNIILHAPFVLDLSRAKSIIMLSGAFLTLGSGVTLILSDTLIGTYNEKSDATQNRQNFKSRIESISPYDIEVDSISFLPVNQN